ncbi:MAG: response regulator [Rhodospirillales bacterium]|nr:response regulator [Rhodospirillales bacterium]
MSTELFGPGLTKFKVLVVDDEQVLRTMIVYSLQALGIKKITLANNGDEALLKMEIAGPFDLIICDWVMPGMNGLDYLKKIRADNCKAKFLMLTGKATGEAVAEAMAAGADSYIAKPFNVKDLRKRLVHITKDLK